MGDDRFSIRLMSSSEARNTIITKWVEWLRDTILFLPQSHEPK